MVKEELELNSQRIPDDCKQHFAFVGNDLLRFTDPSCRSLIQEHRLQQATADRDQATKEIPAPKWPSPPAPPERADPPRCPTPVHTAYTHNNEWVES
jgi:hypothetical protein